ncbi:MAG: FkbM family methyltransferase [Pseudomonadota bacterium]
MITIKESLKKLLFLTEKNFQPLIVDAGANVGDFTQMILEILPGSKIIAFEPTPKTAIEYRMRLSDNINVSLFEYALSSKISLSTFYINEPAGKTNSLLPRPINGKKYYSKKCETTEKIFVKTIDLDTFVLENLNDSEIHLLKMDLQGGEIEALKGMTYLLKNQKIQIIVTEAMFIEHYESQPLLKDIWTFLSDFRYTFFDLVDVSWMNCDGQIRQGDAVFVSQKIRMSI